MAGSFCPAWDVQCLAAAFGSVIDHLVSHSSMRAHAAGVPFEGMLTIFAVFTNDLCRFVFQGVHQLLQFSSSAEGSGRPWQPDEKKYCKLVFIGKNLDRKELNDAFNACLVAAA
jgi:G3E family GTPase